MSRFLCPSIRNPLTARREKRPRALEVPKREVQRTREKMQRFFDDRTFDDAIRLHRGIASWRFASESLELTSKLTVSLGTVISYAACSDLTFVDPKLLSFAGGTVSLIGTMMMSLSTFCKTQASERATALDKISKSFDIDIVDVSSAFSQEKEDTD